MREKLLAFIALIIFYVIRLTCRYKLVFTDKNTKFFYQESLKAKNNDPHYQCILAFFHQDELSVVPYFTYQNIGTLISTSKDGEIMSTVAKWLGYKTVRGSSSKKAVSGMIAAIKLMRKGYKFSFAVDGPRGPIYKAKEGASSLSKKLNVPILPMRAYPKKFWLSKKSWNQAKLPMPFSTIEIHVGSLKKYSTQELEEALLKLTPSL